MASDSEESTGSADIPKQYETEFGSDDELSILPNRKTRGKSIELSRGEAPLRKSGNLQVVVPAPLQPWKYEKVEEIDTVDKVLEQVEGANGEIRYQVLFEDGREEEISSNEIMKLRNGRNSVNLFNNRDDDDDDDDGKPSYPPRVILRVGSRLPEASNTSLAAGKRTRGSQSRNGLANVSSESDGEDSAAKRQRISLTRSGPRKGSRLNSVAPSQEDSSEEEDSSASSHSARYVSVAKLTRGKKISTRRSARTSGDKILSYKESSIKYAEEDDSAVFASDVEDSDDILFTASRSRRSTRNRGPINHGRGRGKSESTARGGMKRGKAFLKRRPSSSTSSDENLLPTRVSGRATKTKNSMKERLEDEEDYAEEVAQQNDPKVVSVREVFQPLSPQALFRRVHNNICDVCDGSGTSSNKGSSPLIQCQGCSTSIHKACLGNRSAREHVVTKIAEDNFVMQCRRCVGIARKKDDTAPRLDVCQVCKEPGVACAPFSQRKTAKQEQKIRDENEGKDPITLVDDDLINNVTAVMFRCTGCRRGFHFQHLPALEANPGARDNDPEARLKEYCKLWQCKDCIDSLAKVQTLVAWRPTDQDKYIGGQTYDQIAEDNKEYFIKWESLSYFRCTWMPGAWVWGVTSAHSRKAFARREDGRGSIPINNESDAIPEEFLRMEIVMDVKYFSLVSTRSEEVDKARVREVEEVFVKFTGLGYDEVVWERPPSESEEERWRDFVAAYNEYVAGKYFKQPPAKMKDRIDEYRKLNFEKRLLMEEQPASMVGGNLMAYQLEGLNWLLYNFHQGKNAILADEMGLGKTIQVIGTIATLVKEKPKCWPFLIVVPNSTCPNWRREIKKWAPSLRVVAYYGLRQARDMAMKYELYPDGCTDLRAHVVVTSFDAPVDDHSRQFFRRIRWAGMIVDEGQRLKNDKNLLYGALSALKVPFRVLMTGTPLQNNKRELFNLLQFIDTAVDAEELDEKYAELTEENLPELHRLIKPYFLRRTKIQVLKFLPPLAQVIIPVTMSVLQKKVYKSILSRSPDLIKAIMTKDQAQIHPRDRGSLNNMLMQLRKVLCHPFMYSEAIEEKTEKSTVVLHRNLVDAASKLQLLEIMLPKLKERGHRVLIFSQFLKQLDIIEDFLFGLGLSFQRLDGNIGSLEKQKRIDLFNAEDSQLFAFLLSTRAGGVGINLATADTVIIMDPDFNPHQDIQALSRAHRIGQKKKVLVFQFMTKGSAEEKIVQIGRKKMALDHVLIEAMDADEDAGLDLQSILKHGAAALFNDDDQNDIKYDSASVDKLLDRSQIENTNVGDDKSAESQFSYARIWANDAGALVDDIGDADSEKVLSPTVWEKILQQRENQAARDAAAAQKVLGRGKRMRQAVDYRGSNLGLEDDALGRSPEAHRITAAEYDDNSDFMGGDDVEEESEPDDGVGVSDPGKLEGRPRSRGKAQTPPHNKQVPTFRRVKVAKPVQYPPDAADNIEGHGPAVPKFCHACGTEHYTGYCPLKITGVENCNLCGVAHFGYSQTCPHLKSETQVRLMLDALKFSPEPRDHVEQARSYLRGVIGNIVRMKKLEKAKERTLLDPGKVQPPMGLHASLLVPPPNQRSQPQLTSSHTAMSVP